ncbi:MAG TPA: hypothetical protein VKZ63_21995 [Kofleriaceae bacterium]|nr:hypothetical protein [Kofleriaceae bacterium]
MARNLHTFLVRIAAVGAAACSSAYAVHSAPDHAITQRPTPLTRSPYEVELIDAHGRVLDTYAHRGRYYIHGQAGDRYSIRVKNPTGRRVEAVISVDGLDVIDGETADFARKRGYVVPAYGELTVDGFRMSTTHVAAFRFSSVASSYAGRKGKARNVGVIGVAIFAEKEQPQVIMPAPGPVTSGSGTGGWYRGGSGAKAESRDYDRSAPAAGEAAPAPRSEPSGGAAPPRTRAPARIDSNTGDHRGGDVCCRPQVRQRPGLGTEWGEHRYSAVDFTRFVRAHATVPTAMAELRYNDSEGLRALGIRLAPSPDQDELYRRETADPFPGSHGFAAPPP